ncbi:MAG: Gfo/Idh/MocA family oxidoreductase, partial [Spirochaetales bacterium]|nr:Gfo/Idh/MocA family oxidoreductase [Spirochaetales bacterium]
MMKTQKIGIVGAGGMAAYHFDGFVQGGAEVAAVADPNPDRAAAFAKPRGITRIYQNLGDMLRGLPELAGVSIGTPNKFHKPLTLEALKSGRHVYCEKPPALNAGEMTEMLDAALESGRLLMFDFNNRARPEAQAMMSYIRSGRAGV